MPDKDNIEIPVDIVRSELDDGSVRYRASISSEYPVPTPMGPEVLLHNPENIDMERASRGLPIMVDHKGPKVGWLENIEIKDRRLVGDLKISRSAKSIRDDLDDGIPWDLSVSAVKLKVSRRKDGGVNITRWKPVEASFASLAKDPTVGINRSQTEDKEMADKDDIRDDDDGGSVITYSEIKRAHADGVKDGEKKGQTVLRKLAREIDDLCGPFLQRGEKYTEFRDRCVRNFTPIDDVRKELFEMLANDTPDIDTRETQKQDSAFTERSAISQGETDDEKFAKGFEEALTVRAKLTDDKEMIQRAHQSEFLGMSLMELTRTFLRRQNVTPNANPLQMVGQAMVHRANSITHYPSDFPNLLENIANKGMMKGYTESPETWEAWAEIGNLSDFKEASRTGLGEFPDLDLVDGEYKYATMGDRKEPIKLLTYGKLFSLKRETIINDDLRAFTEVPRKMARAAARKVGDLAYSVITTNAALNQDGIPLFDAQHGNLGTPGAPSVATLDELVKLAALQTDGDNIAHGLNIQLIRLIGPVALRATLQELATNIYDFDAGNTSTRKLNPHANNFQVITDPRLDKDSPTAWYGFADQAIHDIIEVAFLNGVNAPFLETSQGWSVDGVEYKVRIDAGASALGYQGVTKNAGA